ncbi:MHS family MFS transporter [Georgenia yuyongxinii]|uniref:Putative proline/betaine transporter n=1 Tax=Georgenia yuyongxinii TaxID=2589797 RepID=A0A5B8BZT1_9MICO|nr:MFS transporter [Georgenia yuyongxinii]QDC23317.1 MHS family MFS transporter [Georgenia yuyongxinii]
MSKNAATFGADTPVAPHLSPEESVAVRKAAGASFIGNFVEWFDYASYGYLATTIAVVFFPTVDPVAGLLSSFAVFAVSFILRPIGAVFWGNWGDKYGRRWALSWSILVMSASTFLIAFLPGHTAIGIAAPLLLLLLRMVQGFSASGEYAGAAAFMSEYAPPGKRGLYTSIVPASTAAGLLFGSLFVFVLHALLSDAQLESWGWRIPFLLAAPLGWVGRYIRVHLEDSPVYLQLARRAEAGPAATPVREVLRKYFGRVMVGLGVTCLNAVAFYLVLSYLPTYLSAEIGMDDDLALLSSTISLAVYIGLIFLMGHISDTVGRKRMLVTACVLFIVLGVPAFWALDSGHFVVALAVQILLCAILTMNDGTLATFLSEIFPTRVRYTGFALSFNTANALFGGTAPLIVTWLIATTGSTLAPGWYLAVVAGLALGAMLTIHETAFKPLPED